MKKSRSSESSEDVFCCIKGRSMCMRVESESECSKNGGFTVDSCMKCR